MGLDGMGMMLKSLGINPEEIKQSIEGFKNLATSVAETQKGIDAKLSTIISGQVAAAQDRAAILGKLDELLSRGAEVEGKEEMAQQFAQMGEALPAALPPSVFEDNLEAEAAAVAEAKGVVTNGDSPGSN